jgi:hypothetical protein
VTSGDDSSYDQMAKMWAQAMTTAFAPLAAAAEKGSEQQATSDPTAMIERASEVHLATVNSGFRYLRRWSELAARAYPLAHRATVLSATGDSTDLGRVLDELREVLRELAELPYKESRRLQQEIMDAWAPEAATDSAEAADSVPKRKPPRGTRGARVKE